MTTHKQVTVSQPDRGWKAEVDIGMAGWVTKLWNHGVSTLFSCQNLNSMYGRQVVLPNSEYLDLAVKLLPWATRASENLRGYVSLTEKDDRPDDYNWHTIWEAGDL